VRFSPLHQGGRFLRSAGNHLLRKASLKGIWIDVGAHHGDVTLDSALRNPGLTVYAFEPNLQAASSLFGRAPNYVVIPMAVFEADGTAELRVNSFEAASSLLPMDENARRSWRGGDALREVSYLTVPTIRLDTFMDLMAIPRVEFLKVDAQGSDLAVIRSSGKRLGDIRRIALEVDMSANRLYKGSPSKDEVLSFLTTAGFKLVSMELQSEGQEENLTFECSRSR